MGVLSGLNFNEIPDLAAVPEGEYELRIVSAEDYSSKSTGNLMIRLVFEIQDQPNAESIYFYLGVPNTGDDDRVRNAKLRRIKSFVNAFGINPDGEYADWIGSTGWALVSNEINDRTGSPRNDIKRFIIPA